jgi:hypothetical protein
LDEILAQEWGIGGVPDAPLLEGADVDEAFFQVLAVADLLEEPLERVALDRGGVLTYTHGESIAQPER